MKINDVTAELTPVRKYNVVIPESLQEMHDQDLAKRLTIHYLMHDDVYNGLEILEEFSMNVNNEEHSVALIKVHGKDIYAENFQYTTLTCGHDLLTDRNANISDKCFVKNFANQAKSLVVRNEYKKDSTLYDSNSLIPQWRENSFEFMIIDLVKRFENQEWIGAQPGPVKSLYIQEVAEILGVDFEEIDRIVQLLVNKSELYRTGNIIRTLHEEDVFDELPSRLWATHVEKYRYCKMSIHIFLPESIAQPQEFLIKVYKDDELYAIEKLILQDKLDANENPSEYDQEVLEHWLFTKSEHWRKPYMAPYRMKLNFINNAERFDNNTNINKWSDGK